MLHERHDVRHAVNGHAVGKRRLRCVRRGDVERPDARAHRGHRHRQNAVHRAKRAGQRELADKGRVLRGGLDLLCTGKDAEQDGQVIERASFFRPAGARFTVMRETGNFTPQFFTAARTRSRDSLTAVSPRPTMSNAGKPPDKKHSTVTS
mgnify:CR=1 FL=1